MKIHMKRVYDEAAADDGYRVLVDRLWPRGVKKEALVIDEWCKQVAPSKELRRWFDHDPVKFDEFKHRYEEELAGTDAPKKLLDNAKNRQALTLLFAAKDPKINHAVVLQAYLERMS